MENERYFWGLDHMAASAQELTSKMEVCKHFPLPEYKAPLDGGLHFLCQMLYIGLEKNVLLINLAVHLLGTYYNTIYATM